MAIGALNDLVDAPADAGRVPPKPIPAQEVSVATARTVALVAAAVGLGLAAVVDVRLVGARPGRSRDRLLHTTSWPRGRHGHGCRSPWVSRCCRSTAGSGRPVPCPSFSPCSSRWRCSPAPHSPSRMRGPTWTPIVRPATASVATVLGPVRSWWLDAGLMAAATGVGVALVGRASWGLATWTLVVAGTVLVTLGLALGRGVDYARAAAFVGDPGGRCGGRRDRVGRGDDAGRVLVGRHGSIAVNPVSRVHQTGRARSRSPAAASRSSDTSRDCPGRRRRSN